MQSKLCSKCNQTKTIDNYGKKGNRYQSLCKPCQREYAKQHYYDNKKYYIDKAKINNKKNYNRNRKFVDKYKSNKGCKYCSENDSCCLDFHHIKNKSFSIANRLTDKTLTSVKNEIKKCIVVCANCHRKLHAGKIKG